MKQQASRGVIFLVVSIFLAFFPNTLVQAEAVVGREAPHFSLESTFGNTHSLSDYRGKFVVLEWINHDCPFVQKHYRSGNMQQLQQTYVRKGVVWISINSSAPGKQGNYPAEVMKTLTKKIGASPTTVLLDPTGQTGRSYGAKTTPHMFIIDPKGIVIYNGAIDDKPSTNPDDVASSQNYISSALDEALSGKRISKPATQPYGCSVKY